MGQTKAERKRRRTQGSGGLYRDTRVINGVTHTLWRASVELPPGPDGKRRRKVVSSSDYATAVRKLRELQATVARDGDMPTRGVTVADWADQWLADVRPRLKARTWAGYEQRLRIHILPVIGRNPIARLTPRDVTLVYTRAIETGKGGSVRQIRATMSAMLNGALAAGHVTSNVADRAHGAAQGTFAKPVQYDIPALDDALAVMQAAADHPLRARWATAFLTGLRSGEILGLTRDSVDLAAGTLTVHWQLQRLPAAHGCAPSRPAAGWPCGRHAPTCPASHTPLPAAHEHRHIERQVYLVRPKSATSVRVLPLVKPLAGILAEHLDRTPPTGDDLDMLWRGEAGRVWTPDHDARVWKTLLADAGVTAFKLHSARLLAATLMMRGGVPEEVAQRVLGHAHVAMTRHYQHANTSDIAAALEAVGQAFTPAR